MERITTTLACMLRRTGVLVMGLWLLAAWGCERRTGGTTAPESPRPKTERKTRDERPAPAPAGPQLLLRGGRVMTAAGVEYPAGDVLLAGDRITAVGAHVTAPADATVIDVRGKVVTPGLIDTHSHIGVYAVPAFAGHSDGNEMVAPTTPAMRAGDAVWPQDPQLERARAGGVTTMQILPGSANLIGGRSVVIRPRPGLRTIDDARFEGAPAGLKMACGENPKRQYAEKGGPATRMGNVAGYRKAFQQAVEYRRSWQRYRDKQARWEAKQHARRRGLDPADGEDEEDGEASGKDGKDGKDDEPPDPPVVDDALETLVAVLEGEILVHVHCYRADEMSVMLDLARSYGFRIRSFHHAVEAYKIADLLAERDVAVSLWADWWGFKAEAFDGIRENAALVSAAGGRPIIHSDSALGIQRLNQEAAKALYAGRRMGLTLPDDEALRWITANPAWALGLEAEVGTLEVGKRADLVVWSGDPWSVYTKMVGITMLPEEVIKQIKTRRTSVNDLLKEQMSALMSSPKLSKDDTDRLQLHYDAIRDIEVELSCQLPPQEELDAMAAQMDYSGQDDRMQTIVMMHMNLIAFAFACDYTRAATLQIGDGADGTRYRINGQTLPRYHQISHRIFGDYAVGDPIPDAAAKHHMIDREHGKPSLTRWRVIAREGGRTRLALEPLTGRSHQLRVHLAAIGHPIVGDALYAPPEIARGAPRLLLHACALAFAHPEGGQRVQFASATPF